ncbi:acyl carrier protein [Akkermansiaceae bacterium]|nr:acyl carrier protein [Akkermansiaceae bacterium]
MTNLEKYKSSFITAFELDKSSSELENLEYQSIVEWDSVGHMGLVAALEESFDIMLEMDDIVDLSSFKKGIEILEKNGVSFK